jgi:hypothetical protein
LLTKGLIFKFYLYIPQGAMALHSVQVFDGSFQLWPTTPGKAFRGDGVIIEFDDLYSKIVEPYELQIKSWNEDLIYPHTAFIHIGMVTEEAFMMRFLPGLTYDKMLEVLQKLQAEQDALKAAALVKPFGWIS